MKGICELAVVLAYFGAAADAANILAFAAVPAYSHQMPVLALTKALAARGHNVTVVTAIPSKVPVPNHTEIDVSFTFDLLKGGHLGFNLTTKIGAFEIVKDVMLGMPVLAEAQLKSPAVKNFMSWAKDGGVKWDVVLYENLWVSSYLGLAHWLGAPPVVAVSTVEANVVPFSMTMGSPLNLAYGAICLPFTDHMTFYERLVNVAMFFWYWYYRDWHVYRTNDRVMRELFGEDVPGSHELEKNVSLLIYLTYNSLTYPQAFTPNIVQVGATHIHKPNPLPKILLLVAACWVQSSAAANILALSITPSYSHQMPVLALTKALAARGHNLTVVTPNPSKVATANYTEIDVSFAYELFRRGDLGFSITKKVGSFKFLKQLLTGLPKMARAQLTSSPVKHFLRYMYPSNDRIVQEVFGKGLPTCEQMERNLSLLMHFTTNSLAYPQAFTPNIVHVGPTHILQPKPLPKDLEDWVSGADEGVVYFSLGSNMQGTALPVQVRDAFLNAFVQLTSYRVLWKWETDTYFPGDAKNVLYRKWIPQQDLLAHPKVKLFITQGGLQSLQEAIHHAVPVIGIPFFADQYGNVRKIAHEEVGIALDLDNINNDTAYWAVNEVLHNPKYRQNMRRLSDISRDTVLSPLDQAVWWVEYVIRHHGARHLRPATLDLHWTQYYLVDVAAFVIAVAGAILVSVFLLVRFVYRKFMTTLMKDGVKLKGS